MRTRCSRSTRRRVVVHGISSLLTTISGTSIADRADPADITVDGRPVKAVVQLTKQGLVFVLDRVTGKPVWPIEERPVPKSDIPGEWTSPTQPFPTKPAGIEMQGLTETISSTSRPRSRPKPSGRRQSALEASTRPHHCRTRLMARWAR